MNQKNQTDDFNFFEKYSHNTPFKLKNRFTLSLKNKTSLMDIIRLIVPSRLLKSRKALNLKYKYDYNIIKNNMQSVFKKNEISFMNYNLDFSESIKSNSANEKVIILFNMLSLINEIFIKDQYGAKQFLSLNEKSVIFDCGANMGIFSLFINHLNPKAQIYAFEPASLPYKLLTKIIKINNLAEKINPLKLALGDKITKATMDIVHEGAGLSNVLEESQYRNYHKLEYSGKEKVQMTTIDQFVCENNLKHLDLLKIDTEGFEKQIIQGAKETIKKFKPVIACSGYHLPDDEKVIPEAIFKLNGKYRLQVLDHADKNLIFY